MSQWHKIDWSKARITPGMQITVHPHTDDQGKKTARSASDLHPWHELDWHSEDAKKEGAAHLHDGKTDHIRLVPEMRQMQVLIDGKVKTVAGLSLHAVWHDKDGNVL